MNEIIERVAELLAGAAAHPTHCSDYLWQAHAVIEAMREPTEAMTLEIAGTDLGDIEDLGHIGSELAATFWRAMVDEALKD
jgi:hypothetical protein